MEKTRLGRTGIEVSRLCIDCMQASGWASSDNVRFVTTVRHALDMGLNFLDTAAAYGDGYSEELVSDAIARRRDQVVIATKFNFNQSHPKDVRFSLERSLRRLRTDYIDFFQQHCPPPDFPGRYNQTSTFERTAQKSQVSRIMRLIKNAGLVLFGI